MAAFIVQRYYCKLLYGIAIYDHLIDDLMLCRQIPVLGGSKLGLIHRMMHIPLTSKLRTDKQSKNEGRLLPITITRSFANSIRDLNRSTGFYRNKTEFCKGAIGNWTIEYRAIQSLVVGVRDEESHLVRMFYDQVLDHSFAYYSLYCEPQFRFLGLCSSTSDSKNWLDKTYIDDKVEFYRRLEEMNRQLPSEKDASSK